MTTEIKVWREWTETQNKRAEWRLTPPSNWQEDYDTLEDWANDQELGKADTMITEVGDSYDGGTGVIIL